jgi:alkylation response protein AidB-like acyl-CoA dehydrogenase
MTMYRLDSQQELVLQRVRKVGDADILPHADEVDAQATFPQQSINALSREELLGLTVPVELGGLGQGLRVACAALEEVAHRCPSTAMVYLMHLCGIACYSSAPDKTAAQLRAAASGQHLSTLAWSERGSRSHFWAPVSEAIATNGNVSITAEKSWVTSAGHADGYVVSTRRPGAESPTDTTLYMVLDSDPGLKVAGPWNALGMRGNASAPMTLTGVTLGPERALSEPGKGFEAMLSILPVFQLANAAIAVGIAEAAVQAAQKHITNSRFQHLGSSLADLPNLRANLARMRIETDKARAHLVSILDSLDNPGPETQLLVLEAKAAASEAAVEVTDLGMRTCGGAAFSRQVGLERYFRDARAAIVMAPTSDHAYEFIGRALCGMELF